MWTACGTSHRATPDPALPMANSLARRVPCKSRAETALVCPERTRTVSHDYDCGQGHNYDCDHGHDYDCGHGHDYDYGHGL
ncbi:hypothetical protein STEG23_000550 [Scotinomys teguina]